MKALFILPALAASLVSASGQSINVDLNISDEVALGGGVPSDGFGGAANQPGRWNALYVIGHLNSLFDLNGVQRNVSISIDASNNFGNIVGGGFANLTNTGDYARLLNDAGYINDLWRSWTFHGLSNGQYRVVTYAVRPFPIVSESRISVNGGPIAFAFGPMPGNQLIQGITHVVQDANVTDGTLTILVARNPSGENAACNGFQITAVPEPGTLIGSSLAMIGWVARRRARRSDS